MERYVTPFLRLALVAPALAFASPALAEGVGAGTLIENTAQASYDTPSGPVTVDSNTVTLRVDEILDVTVSSLDAGPINTVPGTEVLSFEITNTGNGPEAFRLTPNPAVAGNDFDVTIERIAVDTNGNGVFDDGVDEVLTSPETTDDLAADESLTVFVVVTVPGSASDTDTSDVELLAEAVTGTGAPGTTFAGQGEDGGDAVVGLTNAEDTATGSLLFGLTTLELTKSATIADPFGGTSAIPGAIVTYTITADVTGSGSIDNLVVSDPFPTGTTYRASTLALDSTGLTDAAGDDAGEASATAISVTLGTVSGGTTHTITFDVSID